VSPSASRRAKLEARRWGARAGSTAGTTSLDDGEIVAERLYKSFGPITAVEDVSFSVGRGEVVGFLGPNGAGKSTTLRILTGVFPPTSGRVSIAGHDVVADALAARRSLGYLPERAAIYGEMTVESYLRFVAEMKALSRTSIPSALGRVMADVGISRVAHRLIGTLSKGYRQRVGIAQALIGDPPVLVLDEPTSGLDPEQVTEIRSLIRGLGAERTVILSTHILPEVESICSRVMIMHRGRILAVDAPARLEERLRPYREVLVEVVGSPVAVVAALRAVPHVVEASFRGESDGPRTTVLVRTEHGFDVRQQIARALADSDFGLLELRPVTMTLEEIFLALVGTSPTATAAEPPGDDVPAAMVGAGR
jgi:ABC-2 type transport system ATP-binding protein